MRKLAAVSAVALVITAQAGGYALAQDVPASEEEKQLKLDKQREELLKQKLENEQLRETIAASKLKAITDAIPTTTSTGATTMNADAGKMESSALTAVALNGLADQIAADARAAAVISGAQPATLPDGDYCKDFEALAESGAAPKERHPEDEPDSEPSGADESAPDPDRSGTVRSAAQTSGPAPILLLAGDDPLTFAHWDQFRFRACAVHTQLSDAIARAGSWAGSAPVKSTDGGSGITTALSVGSKLLQLLQTDWEVKGIAGTATEKALLAAVARAYVANRAEPRARLYWASQVSKLGGSRPVFAALSTLEKLDSSAQQIAEAGKGKLVGERKSIAALEKRRSLTRWETERLGKARENVASGTRLAEARAAYAALVASLAGEEGKAALPIGKVIEEAAAAQLLGPTGLALNLNLETHGGGYYTRKSVIDSLGLGGPPAHVSGGAVVSFLAVRPSDLQVMGAGLFTCNAGYVKLSRVALRTNVPFPGRAAACPTRPVRR